MVRTENTEQKKREVTCILGCYAKQPKGSMIWQLVHNKTKFYKLEKQSTLSVSTGWTEVCVNHGVIVANVQPAHSDCS